MAKHEYRDDGPLPPSTAVGHETTDAEAAPVLKFLLVLGVVTVVTAGVVVLFYNYLEKREAAEKTARYPMAAGRFRPLPPPPRLQTYAFDDIKDLRRSQAPLLRRYEWVDKNAGVVRIPIDRAIELVADRGLPHRAAAPPSANRAGAGTEDAAGGTPPTGAERKPGAGGAGEAARPASPQSGHGK